MRRSARGHLDLQSLLADPWPDGPALDRLQGALAAARPTPFVPGPDPLDLGGVFVCWPRGVAGPGAAGDPGWAWAAVTRGEAIRATAGVRGTAGAPYLAGHLAAREGPILEAAVRALDRPPEVLLVNATGRDHPRRAGLAIHLGAVLGLPTVGVTHRPLFAQGALPAGPRGARTPLTLAGRIAGAWLVVAQGVRPLAVHPGWRTDLDTAVALVLRATGRARTPRPLRAARRLARTARAKGPQGPRLR